MAWLNPSLAKWELWEVGDDFDTLVQIDIRESAICSRIAVKSFDHARSFDRFTEGTHRVMAFLSEETQAQIELRALTPCEIALEIKGWPIAYVRFAYLPGSFKRQDSITFIIDRKEFPLTTANAPRFQKMVAALVTNRTSAGSDASIYFQSHETQWLRWSLRTALPWIEPCMKPNTYYKAVPIVTLRGKKELNLMTCDSSGRIAVIEMKACDDMHLPLRGLDAWIETRRLLHRESEKVVNQLQSAGYFQDLALPEQLPVLYFVAPSLRIHPTNEIILKYISAAIEWHLLAVNENWREHLSVVFRKRSADRHPSPAQLA
jgi:hypothetical protein